jgi:AraC-like DNA-binding protein
MPDPSRYSSSRYVQDRNLPIHVMDVPQLDIELHSHDFTEIVFVLDGTGRHRIEEGSFTISAGDVFVINDDRAHGYAETRGLRIINLLFDETRLLELAPDLARVPGYREFLHLEPAFRARHPFGDRVRLRPDDLPMLLDQVYAIERERQRRRPGFEQMAVAHLQTVLIELCRRHADTPFPSGDYLESIGRVVSYLENHYDQELDVHRMAEIACMSQRSLLRHFRAATNLRPKEYLLRVRVAEACKRLRQPHTTIADAAYAVGFTDCNYFTRCFRQIHHLSPTAWRQRLG